MTKFLQKLKAVGPMQRQVEAMEGRTGRKATQLLKANEAAADRRVLSLIVTDEQVQACMHALKCMNRPEQRQLLRELETLLIGVTRAWLNSREGHE